MAQQTDRLIRPAEAARMLAVSRTTLWRYEQQGMLPERVKLSERISGWRYSDLAKLIERQGAA